MLAEAKDKTILLSHGIKPSSSSSEDEAADEPNSDTPFDSFVDLEPEKTMCNAY